MKSKVAIIVLSLVALAMGQGPDSCCRFTAESTPEDPALVKLTLVNIGATALSLAPPWNDKMSLIGPDGHELPLTPVGKAWRDGWDFGSSARLEVVDIGQSLSQTWDLRTYWILTPGSSKLKTEKVVLIKSQGVHLTTDMVVIPEGYVSDKGCTLEAKAAREPNRKAAALVSRDERPSELGRVLDKPVERVAGGPTICS